MLTLATAPRRPMSLDLGLTRDVLAAGVAAPGTAVLSTDGVFIGAGSRSCCGSSSW